MSSITDWTRPKIESVSLKVSQYKFTEKEREKGPVAYLK